LFIVFSAVPEFIVRVSRSCGGLNGGIAGIKDKKQNQRDNRDDGVGGMRWMRKRLTYEAGEGGVRFRIR
jgi:hypothetical protein